MATEIVMPQLGESVTEGTIMKWLVTPGTAVIKYQPICEIMTDKVSAEVPSSLSGIITKLVATEGQTIPVGKLICYIDEQGMELAPQASTANNTKPKASNVVIPDSKHANQTYSPAVLHLAMEHSIDLARLSGTGKGGRITRKDILNYINNRHEDEHRSDHSSFSKTAASPIVEPLGSTESSQVSTPITYSMSALSTTPVTYSSNLTRTPTSAWMKIEVDITDLLKHCERASQAFERKQQLKLTYLPFILHAVVTSLKQYPAINSIWREDRIIPLQSVHVAFDVLASDKLYTPVIRNIDRLNLFGIAQSIYDLGQKAAKGTLSDTDQSEGTFSIVQSGQFGLIESQPSIPYPQLAALSIEQVTKRPVIINDMFAARSLVNLCLSYDDRVLDRMTCGRFMQQIKYELEHNSTLISLY
ncbi:2-oxo acid dehydrogenase subunit E2 [Paenibacillus albiflavus]|uniref:Dihydrolipoamide acetyltransferase component of pyruvate dehydrogenase complex n=1 Tax=Paenibacillus albiflavus TaxID=2545760 RepID=A0A4R4EIY4_9BACL|nr:dihydrolipoamide acetyltransferase family protein [Paenibacillus albiflavus]TCZ80134.1 2-oxo acid dehydrogenase subunit E2 [Paenibacillus albiflavus]